MNAKADHSAEATSGDVVKYVLGLLIAVAGLFAFYWFADWAVALRGVLVVAGLVGGAAVAVNTAKGRAVREYFAETRFELRKVVWPSRDETTKGTIMILVVVVIISLMLMLIDFLIANGVRLLLG